MNFLVQGLSVRTTTCPEDNPNCPVLECYVNSGDNPGCPKLTCIARGGDTCPVLTCGVKTGK